MTAEFTTHLRPKPRVRPSSAPDLAVIDAGYQSQWLVDSRGVLCMICTARFDNTVDALNHRWSCT